MLFLLLIIGSIILYILFAPLVLEINSRRALYRCSLMPVCNVSWQPQEGSVGHLVLNITGFRKNLLLRSKRRKKKLTRKSKRAKGSHGKRTYWKNPRRFLSLLGSFRVKRCSIVVDTGNMALNGRLFPVAWLLSIYTGKELKINFTGRNEVLLTIENNIFRMLKAFFINH